MFSFVVAVDEEIGVSEEPSNTEEEVKQERSKPVKDADESQDLKNALSRSGSYEDTELGPRVSCESSNDLVAIGDNVYKLTLEDGTTFTFERLYDNWDEGFALVSKVDMFVFTEEANFVSTRLEFVPETDKVYRLFVEENVPSEHYLDAQDFGKPVAKINGHIMFTEGVDPYLGFLLGKYYVYLENGFKACVIGEEIGGENQECVDEYVEEIGSTCIELYPGEGESCLENNRADLSVVCSNEFEDGAVSCVDHQDCDVGEICNLDYFACVSIDDQVKQDKAWGKDVQFCETDKDCRRGKSCEENFCAAEVSGVITPDNVLLYPLKRIGEAGIGLMKRNDVEYQSKQIAKKALEAKVLGQKVDAGEISEEKAAKLQASLTKQSAKKVNRAVEVLERNIEKNPDAPGLKRALERVGNAAHRAGSISAAGLDKDSESVREFKKSLELFDERLAKNDKVPERVKNRLSRTKEGIDSGELSEIESARKEKGPKKASLEGKRPKDLKRKDFNSLYDEESESDSKKKDREVGFEETKNNLKDSEIEESDETDAKEKVGFSTEKGKKASKETEDKKASKATDKKKDNKASSKKKAKTGKAAKESETDGKEKKGKKKSKKTKGITGAVVGISEDIEASKFLKFLFYVDE